MTGLYIFLAVLAASALVIVLLKMVQRREEKALPAEVLEGGPITITGACLSQPAPSRDPAARLQPGFPPFGEFLLADHLLDVWGGSPLGAWVVQALDGRIEHEHLTAMTAVCGRARTARLRREAQACADSEGTRALTNDLGFHPIPIRPEDLRFKENMERACPHVVAQPSVPRKEGAR